MSVNTLQRIMQVAQVYIRNAPLTFAGSATPNDLALLAGDWVRQFMLSPPFAWRWNRAANVSTLVPGQQDYVIGLGNFGWLEKATITDTSVTPNQVVELHNKLNLGEDTALGQPAYVACRLDDGLGHLTFRLLPVPDKAYTLTVTYQLSASSFISLSDLWTPIPDYMSYIYQQGFLAKAYEYFADERFSEAMQLFIKQTIAANTGLDDTQLNIFLGERMDSLRMQQGELQNAQLGNQGRYLG